MSGKSSSMDPAYLFAYAAGNAIELALAEVHGSEYALWFVVEHAEAIQRAVGKRLCGCAETTILMATQVLIARLCDAENDF